MATVVVDSNPSLQASLRVDDEGYLLVSVGGGGSSGASPARIERAVDAALADMKAAISALTTLPKGAQLDALLAARKPTLKAALAQALS
jgi:hypothetical protein